MDGDKPGIAWDAVPRKKRSHLQKKARVYGQGDVAEETTETITLEWLLKKMEGYDASQIKELRELKASDLDRNQGRLLLPRRVDRSFLNDGELETLAAVPKKGVSSLFIGTDGEAYAIELKEWKIGLVLTKGWSNVIRKERLKISQKYPLWCFRSRNNNNKLCFTFVGTNQVEQVVANVDNEDGNLSGPNDIEEEEVAKENDSGSHPPDSPDGESFYPGLKNFYLPTDAECASFADDRDAFYHDDSA